jgi:hypothetical protein
MTYRIYGGDMVLDKIVRLLKLRCLRVFVSYQTEDIGKAKHFVRLIENHWSPMDFPRNKIILPSPHVHGVQISTQFFDVSETWYGTANQLAHLLERSVKKSNLLVLILGNKTSESNWVTYELQAARQNLIPVIVITQRSVSQLPKGILGGYPVIEWDECKLPADAYRLIGHIVEHRVKFMMLVLLNTIIWLLPLVATAHVENSTNFIKKLLIDCILAVILVVTLRRTTYIHRWRRGMPFWIGQDVWKTTLRGKLVETELNKSITEPSLRNFIRVVLMFVFVSLVVGFTLLVLRQMAWVWILRCILIGFIAFCIFWERAWIRFHAHREVVRLSAQV